VYANEIIQKACISHLKVIQCSVVAPGWVCAGGGTLSKFQQQKERREAK